MTAAMNGVVWLMEAGYRRRTTVPRVWHAHPGPGRQDGPSTALCGTVIRNAASANRASSALALRDSWRRPSWKQVCKRCETLVAKGVAP